MTKNTPYQDTNQPEIVDPGSNAAPVFGETITEGPGQRVFYIGPPKAWTHRIYARQNGTIRYSALDVKNGNLVGNLIYATMFDKAEAKRVAAKLAEENPDWEFQVRKI